MVKKNIKKGCREGKKEKGRMSAKKERDGRGRDPHREPTRIHRVRVKTQRRTRQRAESDTVTPKEEQKNIKSIKLGSQHLLEPNITASMHGMCCRRRLWSPTVYRPPIVHELQRLTSSNTLYHIPIPIHEVKVIQKYKK